MSAPALPLPAWPSTEREIPSKKTIEFLSIAVLGASGDLAKKKTFPALFKLFSQGFLKLGEFHVFGYARSSISTSDLREKLRTYLKGKPEHEKMVSDFLNSVSYISGAYDNEEGFAKLGEALLEEENAFLSTCLLNGDPISHGGASPLSPDADADADDMEDLAPRMQFSRLFYFALPPSVYPQVGKQIKAHCMNARGWSRVIVEKPFGHDLSSAEELSSQLGALFTEPQIYRIDHYLGKEIVQNLLVMRFANRFFLPLWNRENIDSVQIVFREDFGTEGRGGYFDQYGIIRDIIQNHLMQVLCLVAMEKPVSFNSEDIRDEKVKVLRCIQPIKEDEVVLGQYKGYTDDPTVPDDSNTPTFATVVLRIKNDRWDDVPFILKAGKALDSRKAEIRVQFKDVPANIFPERLFRNEFVMRLQPSEAMYMKFTVKKPGLEMEAIQSELDLSYHERYKGIGIPEAYERLILDTIRGDQQHFVRRDELKAAWEIFTPLLHSIDNGVMKPILYEQGGRGPQESDDLAERVGYSRTFGYVWEPSSLSSI